MESVAGPQLLGVCSSKGGLVRETCAGSVAGVAVGGLAVGVACAWASDVGVGGAGVTGNAVGTGPGGLAMFLRYRLNFS